MPKGDNCTTAELKTPGGIGTGVKEFLTGVKVTTPDFDPSGKVACALAGNEKV